jgi:hypothetical protein
MHRPCTFRQSDIRRAIKATRSSGIEIGRIEIGQDGRIVVVPGDPKKVNGHGSAAMPAEEDLKDLV